MTAKEDHVAQVKQDEKDERAALKAEAALQVPKETRVKWREDELKQRAE